MPFLAQWQNDAARTVPTMRKVQNQTLLPQSAHSFDSLQYSHFFATDNRSNVRTTTNIVKH